MYKPFSSKKMEISKNQYVNIYTFKSKVYKKMEFTLGGIFGLVWIPYCYYQSVFFLADFLFSFETYFGFELH